MDERHMGNVCTGKPDRESSQGETRQLTKKGAVDWQNGSVTEDGVGV